METLAAVLPGLGFGVDPEGRHNDGAFLLAFDPEAFRARVAQRFARRGPAHRRWIVERFEQNRVRFAIAERHGAMHELRVFEALDRQDPLGYLAVRSKET